MSISNVEHGTFLPDIFLENFERLWVLLIFQVLKPPKQRTEYPIFIFDEGSCPNDFNRELMVDGVVESNETKERIIRIEEVQRHKKKKKKAGKLKNKDEQPQSKTEVEEYVLVE